MKPTIEVMKSMQQAVRSMFSEETPIELSFPIPISEAGGMKERSFALYRSSISDSAAFAVVEADASLDEEAQVTFCTDEDPFDKPLNEVVDHTLPSKMSFDEYLSARADVLRCYDSIRPFLWQTPDQAQREQMRQYCEAFKKVVPKDLYSYYHAMNPHFFSWVGLDIG